MSLYLRILLSVGVLPGIVFAYVLEQANELPVTSLLVATGLFALIIIPIEIFMVYKGTWRFSKNPKLCSSVHWWGLPLEEYLFYVTMIPTIMLLMLFVMHFLRQ